MSLILAKLAEAASSGPLDQRELNLQQKLEELAMRRQMALQNDQQAFLAKQGDADRALDAEQEAARRKDEDRRFKLLQDQHRTNVKQENRHIDVSEEQLRLEETNAARREAMERLRGALEFGQSFGSMPSSVEGGVRTAPVVPMAIEEQFPGAQGIASRTRAANAARAEQASAATREDQFFEAVQKFEPEQAQAFVSLVNETGMQVPAVSLVTAIARSRGANPSGGLSDALDTQTGLLEFALNKAKVESGIDPSNEHAQIPDGVYEQAQKIYNGFKNPFTESFGEEVSRPFFASSPDAEDFRNAATQVPEPNPNFNDSENIIYNDYLRQIRSGKSLIEVLQLVEQAKQEAALSGDPLFTSINYDKITQHLINSANTGRQ